MKILGISCFYHDSAAALLEDGRVIAAAQEERFSRKKHDPSFPKDSIRFCLKHANIDPQQVDHVVFYEKPFLKFERLLDTYLAYAPVGVKSFSRVMPLWLGNKLFQKVIIARELMEIGFPKEVSKKLLFSQHHQAHAASAFFPSPFLESAILTIDGVGEWSTTSIFHGKSQTITPVCDIVFPHSLGLLYSAFTFYTGFKVNSGEYKMMGLAPYGRPIYVKTIYENLVDVKEDGSFRLNLDFFDYCVGFSMTNEKFNALFGHLPRSPEDKIDQRIMDIACSIQTVTEDVILKIAKHALKVTGSKNLCLAGGVALNCVANGKILRQVPLEGLWIQPAAGDAGGALGAALSAYHQYLDGPRQKLVQSNRLSSSLASKRVNLESVQLADQMQGSYLGPEFSENDIREALENAGAVFEHLPDEQVFEKSASALAKGSAIGWFQGRMEFGPRALGNRSILADARVPTMQKNLNLKVKYRESFRPFAPAVLAEKASEWFDIQAESPYMLLVAEVLSKHRIASDASSQDLFGIERLNIPRSSIPAVTHVDYSARIQTVHKDTNPIFHRLLSKFYQLTGCPVLVNTSFNVRGEPIVCSPADAYRCFMGMEIEYLVIGDFWIEKDRQKDKATSVHKDQFEKD